MECICWKSDFFGCGYVCVFTDYSFFIYLFIYLFWLIFVPSGKLIVVLLLCMLSVWTSRCFSCDICEPQIIKLPFEFTQAPERFQPRSLRWGRNWLGLPLPNVSRQCNLTVMCPQTACEGRILWPGGHPYHSIGLPFRCFVPISFLMSPPFFVPVQLRDPQPMLEVWLKYLSFVTLLYSLMCNKGKVISVFSVKL